MSAPVATLPMYDWPEVRSATDAFWDRLRAALRSRGIDAPETLARDAPHWRDPELVLSQTCGLPYRSGLHAHVTLIGAPDYGLEGCPSGHYRSALVARAGDPRDAPGAFAGAPFAYNAVESQSGWAALIEALGPRDPAAGLETGAHRASIVAVARGEADIAAIDAVSWRLACAWEPAAKGLRVVAWTRARPGLPMITAPGRDPAPYGSAIAEAIGSLGSGARTALGLRGFVAFASEAYTSFA